MSRKGLPRETILDRYSPGDMENNTRSCHYDNLREHGFPAAEARRIAGKAADHTHRALDMRDAGSGVVTTTKSGRRRNRFRKPFPWEEGEQPE